MKALLKITSLQCDNIIFTSCIGRQEIGLSSPVLSSVWFIKDLWTSNFCISSSLTTTYFQISLKHFLLFIFTSVASMSCELTKHSNTIQQDLNFKMSFFLCQNSPEMSIKLLKSQFYLNLYFKWVEMFMS